MNTDNKEDDIIKTLKNYYKKMKKDLNSNCNLDTIADYILNLRSCIGVEKNFEYLSEDKRESPQFIIMKEEIRDILNQNFLSKSTSGTIDTVVEKIAEIVSDFCVVDDEDKVTFTILAIKKMKKELP